MLRNRYCIANWKMNFSHSQVIDYFDDILNKNLSNSKNNIVICPSYTELFTLGSKLKETNIDIGAQNVSSELVGAFTGEVSCYMLKETGCKWVIIGHSERRMHFAESNLIIKKKIDNLFSVGLLPVLCIGETYEERKAGKTFEILSDQLINTCKNQNVHNVNKMIIAYEPVWAIGTGMIPTAAMIDEAHVFIRGILNEYAFDGDCISILYGGSVSDQNAEELANIPNVDGFLVGGSSLDIGKFKSIITKLNGGI